MLFYFNMLPVFFKRRLKLSRFIKINSKVGLYIYNLSRIFKGFRFKIKHLSEKKMIIFDKDLNLNWQFHPVRLPLYSEGLRRRSEIISASYGLPLINFDEDEIVIDCGANAGDLFLFFYIRKIKIKYFGVEPSTFDFINLKQNLSNYEFNGYTNVIFQVALSDSLGETTLNLDVEGANSSILEIPNQKGLETVDCLTLDEFILKNNINKIKLLKLEAEGAEPEVLLGSIQSILLAEYVAVDCGPERGLMQESTEVFVNKFLVERYFKLIYSSYGQIRLLYKNTKLNSLY
jgi:FkbM family methyltransferase